MFAPARRADRVLSMMLLLADMIALPAAFLITWLLRTYVLAGALPEFHHTFATYQKALPVVAVLWVACFLSVGLYRPRRHLGSMGEVQKLLRALAYLAVSMMATSYMVRMDYSRLMLVSFTVISLPIDALARALSRRLAQRMAPVRETPRILVVGTGEVAARVVRAIRKLPAKAPQVTGAVSTREDSPEEVAGVPVLCGLEGLIPLLRETEVDEVFFASPSMERSEMLDVIASASNLRVHFRLVSDLFEIAIAGTDLDDLARLPIIEIGYGKPGLSHRIIKRLMDVVLSLVLLVVFLPVMLLVWLLLLVTGRGSPIFQQTRVGLGGETFTLYKFRTMRPDCGEYEVAPVSMDDNRITAVGKLLRRTSLDELPQLLNVLKGDMSLVGPRPEMPFIVREYRTWQRHRLDVKPGLTGLWQIMGRKELPLHDNLEYDFYYIRNQSIMLDAAILIRTVAAIFRGKGAY